MDIRWDQMAWTAQSALGNTAWDGWVNTAWDGWVKPSNEQLIKILHMNMRAVRNAFSLKFDAMMTFTPKAMNHDLSFLLGVSKGFNILPWEHYFNDPFMALSHVKITLDLSNLCTWDMLLTH